MSPLALLFFGIGLALLVAGAELLVRGASRLASGLRVTPLIIGLTIVAWGTSAPELAVNLHSTIQGFPRVALGNVVGSNIFNILLILGLSALVSPLAVARQILRRDIPTMIAVSVLVLVLSLDGELGLIDGLILLASMVGYVGWSIRTTRKAEPTRNEELLAGDDHGPATSAPLNIFFILAGLGLLVLGSRWLVDGSVAIAEALGVSKLIVGLTIVAAGTSLPEAATSVIASLRGQRHIAVGNVVGSNIVNIGGVLGVTAIVAPGGIPVLPAALRLDIPIMLAVAIASFPISFTGQRISRGEGLFFLTLYLAFITYVMLDATQHAIMSTYLTILKLFVMPICVVALLVVSVRAYRERRYGSGQ